MQIFLHIPKTAGSTLNYILERQYCKPNAIYTLDAPEPDAAMQIFNKLPQSQRTATQLMRGHCAFGIHRLIKEPSSYFTLLRDPVDRVISHYYFVLNNHRHPDHAELVRRNYSLEEYIKSGTVAMLENGQTRLLAGRDSIDYQADYGKCDEAVLRLAESNLAKYFDVVGLQEEFDPTLLILRKAYSWKPPYYITQNVTQKRPRLAEVSPETLEVIRSYNQMDILLYEHAAARFHDHIAQQGASFADELEKFRAANHRQSQMRQFIMRIRSHASGAFSRSSTAQG